MLKNIRNDSDGFFLAETIAALLILSFTLVSLMISVQYARTKSIINYHDRYVLLKTNGELQKIKYLYRDESLYDKKLSNTSFNIPTHSEKNELLNSISVTIRYTIETHIDSDIDIDVEYCSVVAEAEWEEKLPFLSRGKRSEMRYIKLREDYYFERNENETIQ
jgi:hypothetical protein